MDATETKEYPVGVQVGHVCGHIIGVFGTDDDHGGVQLQCPKCKTWVFISNQCIMFPEDNPVNGWLTYTPVDML